jgi:hypothetical protein
MTEAENKIFLKELYGYHYEKLKCFMTEDGWVLKNIFEINYFGTELKGLFDFKLVDNTWLVRPIFFGFNRRAKVEQIISFNFCFQNSAAETLILYMNQQRELFYKELESKGLQCSVDDPYDNNFQKQILSIINGQRIF